MTSQAISRTTRSDSRCTTRSTIRSIASGVSPDGPFPGAGRGCAAAEVGAGGGEEIGALGLAVASSSATCQVSAGGASGGGVQAGSGLDPSAVPLANSPLGISKAPVSD